MQILKNNTKRKVQCPHCKSKLLISQRDISTYYFDYAGKSHWFDYYYCPCCGERVTYKTDLD